MSEVADFSKCSIKEVEKPQVDRSYAIPMTRLPLQVPENIQGTSFRIKFTAEISYIVDYETRDVKCCIYLMKTMPFQQGLRGPERSRASPHLDTTMDHHCLRQRQPNSGKRRGIPPRKLNTTFLTLPTRESPQAARPKMEKASLKARTGFNANKKCTWREKSLLHKAEPEASGTEFLIRLMLKWERFEVAEVDLLLGNGI